MSTRRDDLSSYLLPVRVFWSLWALLLICADWIFGLWVITQDEVAIFGYLRCIYCVAFVSGCLFIGCFGHQIWQSLSCLSNISNSGTLLLSQQQLHADETPYQSFSDQIGWFHSFYIVSTVWLLIAAVLEGILGVLSFVLDPHSSMLESVGYGHQCNSSFIDWFSPHAIPLALIGIQTYFGIRFYLTLEGSDVTLAPLAQEAHSSYDPEYAHSSITSTEVTATRDSATSHRSTS